MKNESFQPTEKHMFVSINFCVDNLYSLQRKESPPGRVLGAREDLGGILSAVP